MILDVHPRLPGTTLMLCVILGSLLFASCADLRVPNTPAGKWKGKHEVSVRLRDETGSFRFVKANVDIVVTIAGDGNVSGGVGKATFSGCSVAQNRGWFGRLFHLNTDYIITGRLSECIFAQDLLVEKEVSMPFNLIDGVIEGTLFQKDGIGIYPMVNLHLAQQ